MHEYSQSGDSSSRMMTGFMLGAVLGAGIALLLAPATGEETRRRLRETASRLRDNADEALDRVRERIDEARHGMEARGGDGLGREDGSLGFGAGAPRAAQDPQTPMPPRPA